MRVSKDDFRSVLGSFATGITVVTIKAGDGTYYGLTVTAFNSLSLDPPLILICIQKSASRYDLFREDLFFAVNILSHEQEAISKRFSTRSQSDKFEGLRYSEVASGAPVFEDALAFLECRLVSVYPGGDHTIFVGEVLKTGVSRHRDPLVYYRGAYATLKKP